MLDINPDNERLDNLSKRIIGRAIDVHRALGPGLLESAYEECLCFELSQAGICFTRQVPLPVQYKGVKLDCSYRMDIVAEDAIIIEIKAVENLLAVHQAQLLSYLKLSNKRVGLLLNFHVPVLKNGIKRIVNNF